MDPLHFSAAGKVFMPILLLKVLWCLNGLVIVMPSCPVLG